VSRARGRTSSRSRTSGARGGAPTPSEEERKIVQSFRITGRGTVAVVDEHTALPIRCVLRVEITRADGTRIVTRCEKNFIHGRLPRAYEKEVYLLLGTAPVDISAGDEIVVTVPAADEVRPSS